MGRSARQSSWRPPVGRPVTAAITAVVCLAATCLAVSVPARAQDTGVSGADASSETPPSADFGDEDALFEPPKAQGDVEPGESTRRRRIGRQDEAPLEQMSRKQAKSAGFVFGDAHQSSSRTSATLLAATAGLVAHGIGHWYIDQRRTAGILASLEGVSVALVGSALAWQALSDDAAASQMYGRPAMYLGIGLFGMSYVLDVIGAFQDTDIGMPLNSGRTRGVSVQAVYHYLDLQGYPSSNLQLLTAGTAMDLGWGYLEASTDQDVSLDTSVYGATVGARPWRADDELTFAFAEARGQWFNFSRKGRFGRLGVQLRAGVSLGLGHWISQLRNVAVGMAAGYGRRWYFLANPDNAELTAGLSTGYIPFEMFTHFNLTSRLNARLAYEHRDGGFLQSIPAGLAVSSLTFTYRSTDVLDVVVRGEFGGGFGVSGGLRIWLWE